MVGELMIEEIRTSLIIWVVIFLGTAIGGLAVPFIRRYFHRNHLYLNVFCGGILAGLLAFDLIPEIVHHYQPIGIFSGVSLGIFMMLLFEKYLHSTKHIDTEYQDTFFLLFFSLFIHSIPTGLALGLNFTEHHFQHPSLLIAILIHHIPEGMVLMVTVLNSKQKVKIFVLLSCLLSFAVGVNTYLGMSLNLHSLKLQTMIMGIAIGSLSYVTFYEILWKGFRSHLTIKMIIGACLGLVFLRVCLVLAGFGH